MTMHVTVHRVESIELGDIHTGVTDSGPYASAYLTIRQGDGGSFLIHLFAPTADRLRIMRDEMVQDAETLRQVETRA